MGQIELDAVQQQNLAIMFNWRQNLDEMKVKVQAYQTNANSWWSSQVNQWNAYNNNPVPPPVPISAAIPFGEFDFYGSNNCILAAPEQVSGSMQPYSHALMLKQYNGATSHYISFFGSAGWAVSPAQAVVLPQGLRCQHYVRRVCTFSLDTLYNPYEGICDAYNRQAVSTPPLP